MVNVLIPTKADDSHAFYVKLALERKGHNATLWFTADYPEIQTHTFEVMKDKISWKSKGLEFIVENSEQFDVVWFRRPQKPIMPKYLHSDDIKNARLENIEFYKYFWQVIAPKACWVNPANYASRANCKLLQLNAAQEVGLKIPDSLFSNDPYEIKSFLAKYTNTGVIYKPVYPVYWVDEMSLRLTYTNEINECTLPSNEVIQATPGIYQNKIEKSYELRITFMGEQAMAVKLDSQAHPGAKIDWRSVSCFDIKIENYHLPDEIKQRCIALMKKLGLAFGCFDFIVTPNQEYYFLEVNEQGQFLWVEETNHDIKMLDSFANFLIQCGGGETESVVAVSLNEFSQEVQLALKNSIKNHKDLPFNT